MSRGHQNTERGFALVITLGLLALLVLAAYALSAMVRVNSQTMNAGVVQVQARQNALLGLGIALGQLQKAAGVDARATAIGGTMASVTGGNHPARYWCGVWDGGQVTWLASGSTDGVIPALSSSDFAIVSNGSLGAYSNTNENDTVRVPKIPITATRSDGSLGVVGSYAYWVGDEGTKLSAQLGDHETPVSGGKHELSALISGLSPTVTQLGSIFSYEQLNYVPGVSAANRRSSFHQLSLTHRSVKPDGSGLIAGTINVNSSSVRLWRAIGQTYNRLKPSGDPILATTSVTPTSFAGRMGSRIKAVGPFTRMSDFFSDAALKQIVEDNGANWASFRTVMEPWMTVRSDTFRIRAYGEALDPIDGARVEALAYCEVIVQRDVASVSDSMPNLGRRFVVLRFRWLAPPDVATPTNSDI